MTAIAVTFDRTVLSLADLVIGAPSPSSDFWIPEEGISYPKFARRKTRAPGPPHIDGPGALLARVSDIGLFPLTVYAGADTDEALWDAREALQAAVDQWSYDLTLEVGDATRTFTAECVDDEIDWGEIDSGMVRARICRGSIAIPLYP